MILHERLENRTLMELYLKPLTPIHVGAGGVGEITKNILHFTVGNSLLPIIPAESIKGVLRTEASRIAKRMSFTQQRANEAVKLHSKAEHQFGKEEKDARLKEAADFIANLGVFESEQIEELKEAEGAILELYASYHCPICRLFGSKYFAAKLLFTDAIPTAAKSQQPTAADYLRLNTYTSTAINRKTRTVDETKLFRTQYIEPNSNLRFCLKIIADNILTGDEAKLLANILEYITTKVGGQAVGIHIGGSKSRGFGLLEVDEESSAVKVVRFFTSPSKEEKLRNINRLIFKEGSYEIYRIPDFIKLLISSS